MSIYLYVNLVAVYTIYEPALAIIIIATLFMNLTASLINFAKDGLFYHITSTLMMLKLSCVVSLLV